jgi:hypothetical protein
VKILILNEQSSAVYPEDGTQGEPNMLTDFPESRTQYDDADVVIAYFGPDGYRVLKGDATVLELTSDFERDSSKRVLRERDGDSWLRDRNPDGSHKPPPNQ